MRPRLCGRASQEGSAQAPGVKQSLFGNGAKLDRCSDGGDTAADIESLPVLRGLPRSHRGSDQGNGQARVPVAVPEGPTGFAKLKR
jgi:hypothetical protein